MVAGDIEKKEAPAACPSPWRLVGALLLAVFALEFIIMLAFGQHKLPVWLASLLDAGLLSTLLLPILYIWLFRPLMLLVSQQRKTEAALLNSRDDLEKLVASRTRELKEVRITTNSQLAAKQIVALRRVYATLSHVNRSSRHASNWHELFCAVCEGAVKHGQFELAWAGLVGHATRQVTPVCHYGRNEGFLENLWISVDEADEPRPPGTAIRENRVVIINDCAAAESVASWRIELLARGFHSMAALPIRSGGQPIGTLVLYAAEPGFFDEDLLNLLEDMSFEISYALENFEREAAHSNAEDERQRALAVTQKALNDSIQAIAYTLEMRDPYTAGHQRKVAQIATAIARELNLAEHVIEGIHFGSLIHDLGKIALPAEILTRPRRLTPIEMQLMQTHPQAGYDIVSNIDYPWPVAEMILQHHERMDGTGYPQGLKGEDIPLESRILAVADVVDAMTSHRPYREGLGIEKALAEIERGRGTWYDPAVVDACLRLFREKDFMYTEESSTTAAYLPP